MSAPKEHGRQRIESLTFTRFVAAMAIVVFHFGRQAAPFDEGLLHDLLSKAYVGVSYFFVLSGFVMIIAYGHRERVEAGPYFVNRLARIYPVYLLAIALLFGLRASQGLGIEWLGLGLNALLVQAWIPDYAHSFNTPGWSLSVEMFFYAAFPWLYNALYRRVELRLIVLAAVVLWAASQAAFIGLLKSPLYAGLHSTGHNLLFYFPLMHLNQFVIGNVIGLLYLRLRLRRARQGDHDVALVALFGAVVLLPSLTDRVHFHNGLLALLFAPVIVLTAANTGRLARVTSRRPFVFLGEISYGIYILQLPVHGWCEVAFARWRLEDPALRFYVFVMILLAASALSYVALESPLRDWIKRRGAARCAT